MTGNKVNMEGKKQQSLKLSKNKTERNKESKIQKKKKQIKKKRIIVRNLSFKVSENELGNIFSKFGEVMEVKIPLTEAGKKKGFAFVQFKEKKSQIKAMKELNFKEIHGRPIAIDFCVDKTTYQSNKNDIKSPSNLNKDTKLVESDDDDDSDDGKTNFEKKDEEDDDEDTSENEEDKKVKKFLKDFGADEEIQDHKETSDESDNDSESSSSDGDINNKSMDKDFTDISSNRSENVKKKHSEDISEGKTVFIRNLSFKNTEEDLQELVQEYGDVNYCLFCMDRLTDQFKGTAFVKFKEKESADKFIQESYKEPGILLDGRKLMCAFALSREDISRQHESSDKVKDKRNLRLLKCGLIMQDSKEAEGVSQTDMTKRAQLEIEKKRKLKNVNFFVSDKRLIIHNLPKNINDKDLRVMLQRAAGKGAIIKEARVMKDMKKTDAQGIPVSRGFGFVLFTEHEHALKALTELNNNPRIFTSSKRPIVEFSVENKVALLSQERRKERYNLGHKKRIDEKEKYQSSEQEVPYTLKNKKNETKNSQKQRHSQKLRPKRMAKRENPSSDGKQDKKTKKKQKKLLKSRSGKKDFINAEERNNFSVLTNKYKEKLLNKFG